MSNLSVIREELSKTESQFDQHDVPTQILPRNINELSNRTSVNCTNDSQDVHLAPTQKILNIHEVSTQNQTPLKNPNVSLNDNDDFIQPTQDSDIPTQKLDVVLQDKSSDTTNPVKQKQCIFVTSTQDDFSHTQYYDDVFANETFRLSVNNNSHVGIEVDETVLADKSHITAESANESVNMLNTAQVSEFNCVKIVTDSSKQEVCAEKHIEPVKNQVKSIGDTVEVCKEPVNDKNGDDSETDIENDSKKNLPDAKKGKFEGNKPNSADSETDIENSDIKKNTKLDRNIKEDSGSETDIEANKENIKNKQIKDIFKNSADKDDDSETDIDTEINTNKLNKRRKLRKQRNAISEQDSDDSDTDIEASSKSNNKKKVRVIDSDSETDMEDDKHLEILKTPPSTTNNNKINDINNKVINIDSGSETEIEDELEILSKMKDIESTSTNTSPVKVQPTAKKVAEQVCYSSDEEIDLLAPTQKLSESFTDKHSTLDKSKNSEILVEKTNDDNNCEQSKSNADDGFEDDDFELLVSTQMLEGNFTAEKSTQEQIAEAPTQLVENPSRNKETLNSLAPTQLAKLATKKTAEEINSEAPTQLLEPVTKSLHTSKDDEPNDEKETLVGQSNKQEDKHENLETLQPLRLNRQVNDEDDEVDYLAPTQLLEPAAYTKVSNEENEELDSLAPTQLLQPVQTSSDVKKTNVPIYEADTQLLEPIKTSINANKGINEELVSLAPTVDVSPKQNIEDDDVDYLAPTQLLQPPEKSSNCQPDEDDYLTPTQPLHLDAKSIEIEDNDNEEPSENVFLAPTQKLPLQSTPIGNRNDAKQTALEESDEEIDFLVPTQKLSTSIKKSSRKNVSFSEDVFSASTQILPRHEDPSEEHSIFSAPTQKLSPRKSLGLKHCRAEVEEDDDEDFMAPTQLLITKNKDKKSSEETADVEFSLVDDPHYINIDYSSDDTSMKLAISINDDNDFCAPTQKLEMSKTKSDGVEKSTTLKSAKVPEPETQLEVEFDLETQKMYVEAATSRPNNPLANIFGEESTQLTEDQTQPVSVETKVATDLDQNLSSNIETSDSSFQEVRKKRSFEEDTVEEISTKRTMRNVKSVKNKTEVVMENNTRRTSKRAEMINSKYAKTNIVNKNNEVTNSPKKPGTRKAEEIKEVDKLSLCEEETKSTPSTSKLIGKISDDKHTEIDISDKSLKNKVPDTPRGISKRAGRTTEERELETPRKTPARSGRKVNDNKLESHIEEKQESISLKELIQTNKSPEMKLVLTNINEDVENKEENKTSEPDEKIKKPSEEQTVPKKETRRTKKLETNTKKDVKNVVNTRTTRNKSNSNEEASDCKSSKENISELGDFASKTKKPRQATRKTRDKQQVKKKYEDDGEEEPVMIEDSDDSTNSNIEKYIRKQVLKLEYTDESCSASSAASAVIPNPRHNKRSLKIEDYSSDENSSKNENSSSNSYMDTPNTKRRRYEPLNITAISSSQTSNVS